MSGASFTPTPEQEAVIAHDGGAFINACPGAGKTRVMVERAAHVFQSIPPGRGVAFLSFTKAAISELEMRLRKRAILPVPLFPSFIGTFDGFVWQFFVAPFGAYDTQMRPRLIPDIDGLPVKPFDAAQPVPLSCFDGTTADLNHDAARRAGFDPARRVPHQIQQYQTTAAGIRARLRGRGHLGFDDARALALERLGDPAFADRLAYAMMGRFREVIVDEAQDCNPDDLRIIGWLRDAGLPVKIICDPYQSIYQFRGGVTDELFAFRERFAASERKELSGNFRSTANICMAIARLRPPQGGAQPDQALGPYKDLPHPVQVLSYRGQGVSTSIGLHFAGLVRQHREDIAACPVVAATWSSAAKATGQPSSSRSDAMTLRLAEAVMNFHFAPRFNLMKAAMESVHRILLEIEGVLSGRSYHQYIQEHEIDPLSWRAGAISLLRNLKFGQDRFADARAWHSHAKEVVAQCVKPEAAGTIGQRLKWNDSLGSVLAAPSAHDAGAQSIHSVKGMEFPAVCVVTTARTLGGILDFLENRAPADKAEEARELYVAASRAEKLLVFAVPASQAERFSAHLRGHGAEVQVIPLDAEGK